MGLMAREGLYVFFLYDMPQTKHTAAHLPSYLYMRYCRQWQIYIVDLKVIWPVKIVLQQPQSVLLCRSSLNWINAIEVVIMS